METTTTINSLPITLTHSKDAKGNDIDQPVCPPNYVELAVDKRTPARTYRVWVPSFIWPNTDDVPAIYRPLVQAALISAGESILKQRLDTIGLDQSFLPLDTISLDKLVNASATSGRMSADQLLGLWRGTKKYILDVAPKLTTLQGSQLLTYKAKIERFETLIKNLTVAKPENKLSAANLDSIMLNLHDDDAESSYGIWIAQRTEEVRAKLIEDSEAL